MNPNRAHRPLRLGDSAGDRHGSYFRYIQAELPGRAVGGEGKVAEILAITVAASLDGSPGMDSAQDRTRSGPDHAAVGPRGRVAAGELSDAFRQPIAEMPSTMLTTERRSLSSLISP